MTAPVDSVAEYVRGITDEKLGRVIGHVGLDCGSFKLASKGGLAEETIEPGGDDCNLAGPVLLLKGLQYSCASKGRGVLSLGTRF